MRGLSGRVSTYCEAVYAHQHLGIADRRGKEALPLCRALTAGLGIALPAKPRQSAV